MASETRAGVLSGEDIVLRVLLLDDSGFPRNADSLPDVYIYSSDIDSEVMVEEVESATYTSATAGPLVPTLLSTGYYELTYSVPSGAEEGYWRDVWVAELDTVEIVNIQNFKVTAGGTFEAQQLYNNEFICLTLSNVIASLADDTVTLGTDKVLCFTTTYNPFYASVELVRMEAGPLIDYLPDDTIALMIHWASREVDQIRPTKICGDKFPYWRTQFVIADVALRAVRLPGGSYINGLTASSGSSKTLGELSIKNSSGGLSGLMSGGIDKDTYKELKSLRDEIWRVVNAGGCINPGQGLGFTGGIRGLYDPARRPMGRLWLSPDEHFYAQPTANSKIRRAGERMYRGAHTEWRPRHGGRLGPRTGAFYHD